MKLFGLVRVVAAHEVTISLPNNLTGTLAIEHMSEHFARLVEQLGDDSDDGRGSGDLPDLRKMITVGTYMPVCILELDTSKKRKRVVLTSLPTKVNSGLNMDCLHPGLCLYGTVRSVEDHGYIIDVVGTGRSTFSAFLPTKRVSYPAGVDAYVIGQPIGAYVKKIDEGRRVIEVTQIQDETHTAAPTRDAASFSLSSLLPGMKVTARARKVLDSGLAVSFLSTFGGTIEHTHVDAPAGAKLSGTIKEGNKMATRVLYVDPVSKKIGLTALPHVMSLERFSFGDLRLGSILDEAEITRVDTDVGMQLKDPESGATGYVHISRASDEHIAVLEKHFQVGKKVKCRVVGFSEIDGVFNASMQKTVIDEPLFSFEDIAVGAVYKGKVITVSALGVRVSLATGGSVRGLVPTMHLGDAAVQHPEKRFKQHADVTVRVLAVDPAESKATLTMKKSLVQSTLPPLLTFKDAKPGALVDGVINKVSDRGCMVKFYNQVFGRVPKEELGLGEDDKIESSFTVGQVVKCRVVSCDTKSTPPKLTVSFRTKAGAASVAAEGAGGAATTSDDDAARKAFPVGTIVAEAEVIGPGDDRAGDVLVRMKKSTGKSKKGKSSSDLTAVGRLPAAHTSDATACGEILSKSLQAGDIIKVMVLEWSGKGKDALVTAKPMLIAAQQAGTLPDDVDDVTVGAAVLGYVRAITSFGVFVAFLGHTTALAPKGFIGGGPTALPSDLYTVGQTVRATVTAVDEDQHKFTVSLKPNASRSSDDSFLRARFIAAEKMAGEGDDDSTPIVIGTAVEVRVEELKEYGCIVSLPSNDGEEDRGVGFISKLHGGCGSKIVKGTSLTAIVIDHDSSAAITELSVKKGLVKHFESASAKSLAKLVKKLDAGEEFSGTVELAKSDYAVLCIAVGKSDRVLAYLPLADFNTQFGSQRPAVPAVGDEIEGLVVSRSSSESLGDLWVDRVFVQNKADIGKRKDKKKSDGKIGDGDNKKVADISNTAEEVVSGATVKGKVSSVTDSFVIVYLGKGLRGRVHISQVWDEPLSQPAGAAPFDDIAVDSIHDFKVLGEVAGRAGERTSADKHAIMELSMRRSVIKKGSKVKMPNGLSSMKTGQQIVGYVQSSSSDCVWLQVSPGVRGRVFVLDAGVDTAVLKDLPAHFPAGRPVSCVVSEVDAERNHVDLRVISDESDNTLTGKKRKSKGNPAPKPVGGDDVIAGTVRIGRVTKVTPETGLVVQLTRRLHGRVHVCDISDRALADPTASIDTGDFVRVYVLANVDNKIELSLRPSRVHPNENDSEDEGAAVFPEVESVSSITEGQVIKGYVNACTKKGCFISLGRKVTGRVMLSQLADKFVNNIPAAFPLGKLVTARVTGVDIANGQVELSTRKSAVESETRLLFSDLKVGATVRGHIKSVQAYGVFVRLDNSDLTGLCHISEVGEQYVKDLTKAYSQGDKVKAKVLRLDTEKMKISLSLKASNFEGEEDEDDDDEVMREASDDDEEEEEEEEEEEGAGGSDAEQEVANASSSEEEEDDDDDSDGDEDQEDSEEEEEEDSPLFQTNKGAGVTTTSKGGDSDDDGDDSSDDDSHDDAAVKAKANFAWDDFAPGGKSTANAGSDSESDDDDDDSEAGDQDVMGAAAKKRSKKRARAEEEAATAAREQALLDGEAPETADDFERLLVSSPNSSYVWIKYMAWHLGLTQVDQAREVAERALKTIHFREEGEKSNVWVALLNIENMYGSKETLMKAFEKACQFNDPKPMHMQLLSIFEKNGDAAIISEFHKTLTRKFRTSVAVWVKIGEYKLSVDDAVGARKTLDKALEALPRRKHLKAITKFALMEFKMGSQDRGRTMFEGIVSNYPKRADLWNVYIDMELKTGDVESTRRLFDRVVTLTLKPRQMRFFFKRYLEFEQGNGDEEAIEGVKDKARAYVQQRFE